MSEQRDLMRSLWAKFRGDNARVVEEYAAAENAGRVPRRSNSGGISSLGYARRLLADGLKKGWLSSTASPKVSEVKERTAASWQESHVNLGPSLGRSSKPLPTASPSRGSDSAQPKRTFPTRLILDTLERGQAVLRRAGLTLEETEVGLAVERHRWAWKPQEPRVLLIAESHVYTSSEDVGLRVQGSPLPPTARHAPAEFVRLVYCLGYGEPSVLSGSPAVRNGGTPQYWNLFGRIAGTGRQPTTMMASCAERLVWKVRTLEALQQKGVWLLDASLHGVYIPRGQRISPAVTHSLHEIWLANYGGWLLEQHSSTYRCVIGKGLASILDGLGLRSHNWIYQPQGTRSVGREDVDRGWQELLSAVTRGG